MKLFILLLLSGSIYASDFNPDTCINDCMMKFSAGAKHSHSNYNYLNKYCNQKRIDYFSLKRDLMKASLDGYELLNASKFMNYYCKKEPVELISKCVKRVCARKKK